MSIYHVHVCEYYVRYIREIVLVGSEYLVDCTILIGTLLGNCQHPGLASCVLVIGRTGAF